MTKGHTQSLWHRHWHTGLLAVILAVLLFVTLKPYNGNPSALFHIDYSIASAYTMPTGTVVLTIPGYDGMEYWQMARNMPLILSPAAWPTIQSLPPGPYAHQRFLLPLTAFILSFGNDVALPWAFLAINVLALLGACVVMSKLAGGKKLYGFCLALCPPAMIGLHFALAEPLNLLLLALFLRQFLKLKRIDWTCAVLLTFCALTREINIVFILGVVLWTLWSRRWRDLPWLLVPIAAFAALHGLIYAIFDTVPFLWSTGKNAFPLSAIWELISGQKGYDQYTLSSIALFAAFVLPVFLKTGYDLVTSRKLSFLPGMLFVFLGLMLLMPDHIWGSITSVGRVITPVYPLFFAYAAERDTVFWRVTAVCAAVLGLAAGIGLAENVHLYSNA